MINNISNNLPANNAAFKGQDKKTDNKPPYYVPGKNNLPAIASLVMPGLGEYMNDQPNKQSRLAWGLGLTTAFYGFALSCTKATAKAGQKVSTSGAKVALVATGLLTTGLGLLYLKFKSAIQAYRYNPEMEYKLKNKASKAE